MLDLTTVTFISYKAYK